MAYKSTAAAEVRARQSFIVCVQGACFLEDDSLVPGAPDYLWANCERIVYLYEGIVPRQMVEIIDSLQVQGFPFVDGDKRIVTMPRRPSVSNPEFWSRVLGKARQLGGKVTVIGSDKSRLFKYLLDHSGVARNVPRITPDHTWQKGAISSEYRRMLVRLTDMLWVCCATAHRSEQSKYAQWLTQMLSKPSITMRNEAPHLVMPSDFQNCGEVESSAEGQFLKRIRELGYELPLFCDTVTETRQTTRMSTTLTVKLR